MVAVEIKRRGEIDGVEQLTRYLELLNRDPLLAPVKGVFAAQEIKPQARVLAADRGIDCVTVDYAVLKGTDDPTPAALLARVQRRPDEPRRPRRRPAREVHERPRPPAAPDAGGVRRCATVGQDGARARRGVLTEAVA